MVLRGARTEWRGRGERAAPISVSLMLMAIHHHSSGFVYGRSNGCLEFILFRISMCWRPRTLSSSTLLLHQMCVCVRTLFFNQSFSFACTWPCCLYLMLYIKLTPFFGNNNAIVRHRHRCRCCCRCCCQRRPHFSGAMLLIRAPNVWYEIVEQNGSHHHSHRVIGISQIFSFNNQLHKLRFATGFTYKASNSTNCTAVKTQPKPPTIIPTHIYNENRNQ